MRYLTAQLFLPECHLRECLRADLFRPCIPTRAFKVPSGPDWVHEIKHDGYRLQVRRNGDAVWLFTPRY
jgi:ATP-dependent DNA ligase